MFSAATTTRNTLRSSLSLKRHVSSNSTPPDLSLPPKKLRALISIYHKSEDFITPQNLSSAIDRAFLGQESLAGLSPEEDRPFSDLKQRLLKRRTAPTTGTWVANETEAKRTEYLAYDWSDTKSGREKQVIAALYGGNDAEGRPGLEMLLEESERLQEHIADDKALKERG